MTIRPRVGRLERTRFGYGFVRVGEGEDDLFVPPFAMGGALHGDLVVARYLETRREGDAHEIVEVLERSLAGIVGRLEPRGRMTLLLPERPEYPREILLTLRGRSSVPRGGRVVVRLDLKPPEPLQGKVIAVLGTDDAREDSWVVALEEGIRTEFDSQALAEAASHDESSVARAAHGRADFRNDIVRSNASLSYPEAARLGREGGDGIPASLALLDRIARGLRRRRMEEGGLDMDLPEIRARLDERGEPHRFEETKRLPTHELVEEYMLLENRI